MPKGHVETATRGRRINRTLHNRLRCFTIFTVLLSIRFSHKLPLIITSRKTCRARVIANKETQFHSTASFFLYFILQC